MEAQDRCRLIDRWLPLDPTHPFFSLSKAQRSKKTHATTEDGSSSKIARAKQREPTVASHFSQCSSRALAGAAVLAIVP